MCWPSLAYTCQVTTPRTLPRGSPNHTDLYYPPPPLSLSFSSLFAQPTSRKRRSWSSAADARARSPSASLPLMRCRAPDTAASRCAFASPSACFRATSARTRYLMRCTRRRPMGVEAGNRHDTKQKSNEGHPSHTPIHVFQASKLRKGSRSGAAPHGSPVLSRISYRLPQHSSRSTIKNTPGVSKN